MKSAPVNPRRVVILVDNRTRDLPVATLIKYHLRALGVECHLEPLEAYRGVLAACRPGMIVFNHLTASHLVDYSRKLGAMEVLTAVLPNEGILYDEGELRYNAGKFHRDAHIDYYFCWNEPHRQALLEHGFDKSTRIEVVGVPRFDFYFEPWSRVFYRKPAQRRLRPKVLVCTNFVTAKFWDLPREEGDKFFAAWKDRIPIHQDYWCAIEAQHKARARLFYYLDKIAASSLFDLVLRPHPSEHHQPYLNWLQQRSGPQRERVVLDNFSNITPLILDCDLEISCETCTTALESWIAGKPTLELNFEKNPLWFHPEHGACNVACDDPEKIVPAIQQQLQSFDPKNPPENRHRHLQKWCHSPDGTSCLQLARLIDRALRDQPPADWSRLDGVDHRRGFKLRFLKGLSLPYHFNPFLGIKSRLLPQRYAIKSFAYRKSIKPADVREAQRRLEASLAETEPDST